MQSILYRFNQPTPPFFKRLRSVMLLLHALAIVILVLPVAVPALLLIIASYTAIAAFAAAVICQLTVDIDAAFLLWIYGERPQFLPTFFNKRLLK